METDNAAEPQAGILLVDDVPANLLVLEAALEPLGQRLVRVESGAEALRQLLYQDFAVILLDVMMPEMDGYETAALIRARDRNRYTPIIFVTAVNRDDDHVAKGYRLGAVDYLFKPVDPALLRAKVGAFVDLHRRTEQARQAAREQAVQAEMESLQQRAAFLAEAGAVLAGSLDLAATLQTVASLAVPRVADWCVIDLVEDDGSLRSLPLAHADPAKAELLCALQHRYPRAPDPARVIATGEAELVSEVNDELLASTARDADHLALLRGLRLRSYMCVPLRARDRAVGALTFAASERCYFQADLALAGGLARIAGQAIENARLHTELEIATARLERQHRELQDCGRVISHDLADPLRKILVLAERMQEALARGASGRETREYLARLLETGKRMQTRVEALDLYARLDLAGRPFASVDLTAAAREALMDLTPLLERTGGRVEIGELPTIDADPEQMRLLLRHLIANGLTYHRPGLAPVVEVGAESLTDRRGTGGLLGMPLYQLVVSDNGAGFDPRHVDRVFGLFQHLNGYSRYEGLGIGLAICRKIAERHGGAISARSAPDAGARFIVTLPARHAHRAA